ncbi:Hsp70 family protein [Pelagicoccus sp. NFK12]|uniref:Hsp70 family protein n=1 Tax=Pelagicoccus enzymogenes TaxID=2773457 RepID=A0A927FF61_9BACT|nr:hsp70 family protein [Pelagicoccus enzymogenes]MBD5782570.1 Hsp70 family protein [Pelagicoccus enzymogenes]
MEPRYSIGIDLGTTNCALAFVELTEGAESQVLPIRQREMERTEVKRSSLPSFLYLTEEGNWEVGLYARERGREQPERLIHSAKSWLCHHSISPQAKTLPWRSKRVAEEEKLSPIEASAQLLKHLKQAWEERFGREAPFVEQLVTVTVPASFDAAAQAATREAANLAGYPESLRLLEEPQAAFYRWLEVTGENSKELRTCERILVVDIGGGTSDFSLFAVGDVEAGMPKIERVSVSEHLLLGGDNIDLALAHALESELAPDGEALSVDQWGFLTSRARELKERCLSGGEEQISVSIPSKGSALFAGTLATEVAADQARELVLEGFYPSCPRDAKSERSQEGLLEMGLPYATDCAVTRHLAEFLGGVGQVDLVLFNGGSLSPRLIQERLLAQLAAWQDGREPVVLENGETDLAVARGAACYGAQARRGVRRIDAGAARAVFLAVGEESEGRRVCVLPKGAQPEQRFEVEIEGLRLAVNRRARFLAFQGANDMEEAAGEFCNQNLDAMRRLPALDTLVQLEGGESIPVRLISEVNELGLLTVSCESLDDSKPGVWPLEFNLRGEFDFSPDAASRELGVSEAKLGKAKQVLKRGLSSKGQGLKGSRILKDLENALGAAKHEWNLDLCRALATVPLEGSAVISRGADAAESWLQLTGYLLRPGFGAAGDEARLDRLDELLEELDSASAKVEVQLLILLRRVVAGYPAVRQVELFERQFASLQNGRRAEAERVRLLASLEKVGLSQKQRLYGELIQRLDDQLKDGKPISVLLAGFGGLLSRVLLQASDDCIMPPDTVETLFDRLRKLDWSESDLSGAVPLFLKSARVVDDRSLNLSRKTAGKVASKLEKSGVPESRLLPLRDYVPVTRTERASSFGESLPPGLLLDGV